jgi:hypothetical protein
MDLVNGAGAAAPCRQMIDSGRRLVRNILPHERAKRDDVDRSRRQRRSLRGSYAWTNPRASGRRAPGLYRNILVDFRVLSRIQAQARNDRAGVGFGPT